LCYTSGISKSLLSTRKFILSHMAQTKIKKATTRAPKAAKAANTPIPSAIGPACPPPTVRYVGPTSHPSHDHAHSAAQGMKHIWAAPIIAGLALLLTTTFAFNAVHAQSEFTAQSRANDTRLDMVRQMNSINARLDKLEAEIQAMTATQQQGQ
jgi:hypothetical protein